MIAVGTRMSTFSYPRLVTQPGLSDPDSRAYRAVLDLIIAVSFMCMSGGYLSSRITHVEEMSESIVLMHRYFLKGFDQAEKLLKLIKAYPQVQLSMEESRPGQLLIIFHFFQGKQEIGSLQVNCHLETGICTPARLVIEG